MNIPYEAPWCRTILLGPRANVLLDVSGSTESFEEIPIDLSAPMFPFESIL